MNKLIQSSPGCLFLPLCFRQSFTFSKSLKQKNDSTNSIHQYHKLNGQAPIRLLLLHIVLILIPKIYRKVHILGHIYYKLWKDFQRSLSDLKICCSHGSLRRKCPGNKVDNIVCYGIWIHFRLVNPNLFLLILK